MDLLPPLPGCAARLPARQSALFNDEIAPGLAAAGVQLCAWDHLDEAERTFIDRYFDDPGELLG